MPPTEIETERMYPGSIIKEAEGVRVLGSKMATPLEDVLMAEACVMVQKGDCRRRWLYCTKPH